jgi:hypothetical protein
LVFANPLSAPQPFSSSTATIKAVTPPQNHYGLWYILSTKGNFTHNDNKNDDFDLTGLV